MYNAKSSQSIIISVAILFSVLSSYALAIEKTTDTRKHSFSRLSFDLNLEKLPTGYIGHDIANLHSQLIRKIPKKSEFETLDAYKKKVQLLFPNQIYAFRAKNNASIYGENVSFEYDAEKQEMMVKVSNSERNGMINYPVFAIDIKRNASRSHIGINAFGVKKQFKKDTGIRYDINVLNPAFTSYNFSDYEKHFSIPPAKAKSSKVNLAILFIGKLEPENKTGEVASIGLTGKGATIDSPYSYYFETRSLFFKVFQVWVYDIKSGEVLNKERTVEYFKETQVDKPIENQGLGWSFDETN
jgi:hypothetical protein